MNINCRKFRFSTYREHEVTGWAPTKEFYFVRYQSGDNGGKQWNYSLKILLTTLHLKWRSNANWTSQKHHE